MITVCVAMLDTAGEQEKFRMLYETYRGLMFYVAEKILNNPQDAEDAVQQALLAIAKNLHKVETVPSSRTQAFVVIITERKALNLRKVRRDDLPLEESQLSGLPATVPEELGLASAMAKLPAAFRQALMLRYNCGFSVKETAQLMQVSAATAEKTLWRAKQQLRQILEKEGIVL